MASTSDAATQLRTYPAFPAAPHKGACEPVLFIAFFLRNPRGDSDRRRKPTFMVPLPSRND